MAQPDKCEFCEKPRRLEPKVELFYLVEVSGPYYSEFDESTTGKRSKNKKSLWGCRDCVHMVEDTEFWAKCTEATYSPYRLYDTGRQPSVLALASDSLRGEAARDSHKAAERFKPEPFHPVRRERSA